MTTRNSITRIDGAWKLDGDTGFLTAKVYPTRAGIFLYQRADGSTVRELRPPDEVFKADSLASLENKPFTNDHPPANLNAKIAKQYQTGHVHGEHKKSDGILNHTETYVTITDEGNVTAIQNGKTGVSCGYRCDIENTPGEHSEFGRYDAIQRNIKYNHLSSVTNPRAGNQARITQDQARFDAWEINENIKKIGENGNMSDTQKTMRIDGNDVKVSDAAEIAIKQMQSRYDSEIAKLTGELKAKVDSYGSIEAKFDEAQEQIKELKAVDLNARVDSVIKLRDEARLVLGKEFKFDGMNELEIKTAAVAKKRPHVKLDDKGDAYVSERYDAIIEIEKEQTNTPQFRNAIDKYDGLADERTDEDPLGDIYAEELKAFQGVK